MGGVAVIPEPNFPARPDEFVGRNTSIEAFREVLMQGRLTGRTPSFAVLGNWGVGKSSLLLKYFAICSGPEYAMLPVFFSVSTELSDYKGFAEGLLYTFTRTLETSASLENKLRSELAEVEIEQTVGRRRISRAPRHRPIPQHRYSDPQAYLARGMDSVHTTGATQRRNLFS
jgi:hypothetical protein